MKLNNNLLKPSVNKKSETNVQKSKIKSQDKIGRCGTRYDSFTLDELRELHLAIKSNLPRWNKTLEVLLTQIENNIRLRK